MLARAARTIQDKVCEAVGRMKPDSTPLPLLAVGSGSFLVPGKIPAISKVIRVEHASLANAVDEVDRIFVDISRDEALVETTRRAIDAGADPARVEVLEREDIPFSYMPGNARRVRARVIGDALPIPELTPR